MAAAVKPALMGPGEDDDDDLVEVTRDGLEKQRRAAEAKAREAQRVSMTRRSWYTSTAAAEAFQAAVDRIHHETWVPKHEVVAELLAAAVDKEKALTAKLKKRKPPQSHE